MERPHWLITFFTLLCLAAFLTLSYISVNKYMAGRKVSCVTLNTSAQTSVFKLDVNQNGVFYIDVHFYPFIGVLKEGGGGGGSYTMRKVRHRQWKKWATLDTDNLQPTPEINNREPKITNDSGTQQSTVCTQNRHPTRRPTTNNYYWQIHQNQQPKPTPDNQHSMTNRKKIQKDKVWNNNPFMLHWPQPWSQKLQADIATL